MESIKKTTSVFLAIVFLLSSLGFTINKMVCLKSGKVKISLTHVKDCCPKKKSSVPVIKAQCCDLNNTSFHLNDFDSSQKNNIPVVDDFVFSKNNCSLADRNYHNLNQKLFFADLPPPFYGRQLLSFISILTI